MHFKESREPCARRRDALHVLFVRIHKTLRVTPAMAAGVTDKLWEIRDVVAMLEKWEAAN
jgi:hypothetical protein